MYEPGDILGGCRLLKECGSGAFGTVFLAENLTTRRKCALKILPKRGRQWRRELAALIAYQEKGRHENLLRLYHVDQTGDCIFYTMDAADSAGTEDDYVPDTLGSRLKRRGRLSPEELRPVLDELLDGLESLHGSGLLHRDIKPDNIFFVNGRAVLGDIGLVTEADGASFAGTRGFISPAVWKGERAYEARDDLYALGMTVYCALTGNAPRADAELPRSLTLSGCADLVRACNAVLDDASPVRSVAGLRAVLAKGGRTGASPRRRRHVACGIALAALLLAAAGAVFAVRRAAPKRKASVSAPPSVSAPRSPSVSAPVPEKSRELKIAELVAAMEREWRDDCRKRLREAREILVSPVNLGQGEGNMTFEERRRREEDRAARRAIEVQRRIDAEERRLPELKRFAELAVRYFGDVADGDAPEVRALLRHDAPVAEKIGNPAFLKAKYADHLIARSFGWPSRLYGKVEEFARYVDGLPPAERRLWRRRMFFSRLRETILHGAVLLRNAVTAGDEERRLSEMAGYLDNL